jgi:hypothetical protein
MISMVNLADKATRLWFIKTGWLRRECSVVSPVQCSCVAEEVFFGFTPPASFEAELEAVQLELFEKGEAA